METSRPTAREAWLDSLKGFAALLVVLGHVLSGYLDAGTFPAAYDSFYAVRTWIYSFHMPLFFLLSGFTFTLAYYRGGTLRPGRLSPSACQSALDLCGLCAASVVCKAGGARPGQ